MLDASKYAQHFIDESDRLATPAAGPAPGRMVTPTPSLLAALSQLEKEFREILRLQQVDPAEGSE